MYVVFSEEFGKKLGLDETSKAQEARIIFSMMRECEKEKPKRVILFVFRLQRREWQLKNKRFSL